MENKREEYSLKELFDIYYKKTEKQVFDLEERMKSLDEKIVKIRDFYK